MPTLRHWDSSPSRGAKAKRFAWFLWEIDFFVSVQRVAKDSEMIVEIFNYRSPRII